jgi:phage terminase large subunit-like protein
MTRADQQAYQEYLDLCERIREQTADMPLETPDQQTKRIEELKGDFVKFCKYYLGQFMDSDFGWFHKKAAKLIGADPKAFAILEWSREHAKSVFACVMMPMWLYARGEIDGMVVASANQDKAVTLLADLQAQLEHNQKWIRDFGELAALGDWQSGHFTTTDGIGFWAFGRGQSPRGIRKAQRRPNYAVVDDIDDKIIVRNQQRVRDAVDWITEDLLGALSIKGARLVIAGNRIHKQSILAHLVGDVEPDDPKREGITHIKVYAIENKRHNKADASNGRPAWKERYTLKEISDRMALMGYRSARREFFHEHHEEGHVFQFEWMQWRKCLKLEQYDDLIVYCDPSFKDTKKSDFKAIVLLGKKGLQIDLIKAWVRQASTTSMVGVFYDWFEDKLRERARYFIEANMLQDLLLDDFRLEGERRGYHLPIRPDKRNKPNKEMRIENLTPLFERSLMYFNEAEKQSPDMQTLLQQFLGFPYGHDDGPDAVEGGVFYLQGAGRSAGFRPRMGGFRKSTSR